MTAEPINHLASMGAGNTRDMLRRLTDQQLAEQSAWCWHEHDRLLAEPPDGKPYGNRYAAYRMTVTDSAVCKEQRRRVKARRRHHPETTFEERLALLALVEDGWLSDETLLRVEAFCKARGWTGEQHKAIVDRLREILWLPPRPGEE